MRINEKYSYKDFTHQSFIDTDPVGWNNTEVIGTCFFNLKPKSEIFPPGIKNVKFVRCNLDNIVIPKDCTVEGGTHKWIDKQTDGEDWILDDSLAPIEPISKDLYIKLGLSIDPNALPETYQEMPVTTKKIKELDDALAEEIEQVKKKAKWR